MDYKFYRKRPADWPAKDHTLAVSLWADEHERTEEKWKSDCTDPVREPLSTCSKFATVLLIVSFGS